MKAQLLYLIYALTCAATGAAIQFAIARDMRDALVVMFFSFGVLFVTLHGYSNSFMPKRPVKATRELENMSDFCIAARIVIQAGFAFALPSYGLLWLWLEDHSFVSSHGSPVWEQTVFISLAILVGLAGWRVAALQIAKRFEP